MDTNIQKFRAFVKTAEHGSFTRAAEMLNYSQSGISRMVSDLENQWSVTLLERSKGGVSLTSAGRRLYKHAKNVCDEFEKLQISVGELNDLKTGIIRFGTFPSIAANLLPGVISSFHKDYPKIDFEMLLGDYAEIEEWIISGRVDFGFLKQPVRPDLEFESLMRDRFLAVMPVSHDEAHSDILSCEVLEQNAFLLLERGSNCEISNLLEENKVKANVRFTTWDENAILALIESGLGISILPEIILSRTPYKLAVKELDFPAWRDIAVAVRSKKSTSAAVKKFLGYLYKNQSPGN